LRTITALAVTKAFCSHWIFAFGPPKFLLSNNGLQFVSKFFLEVCRELGIARVFTTAYNPQTNGQVERFNRTILNALRRYVAISPNYCDDYTAAIFFGYNSRVHASMGYAWFELVLSRPPLSMSMESPIREVSEIPEDKNRRFVERIKELVPMAKDRLLESQRRYKENFGSHTRVLNQSTSAESWVYLRREENDPNGSSQLDELATEPYRVVKSEGHTLVLRIGDDDVRVSRNRVTRASKPLAEVQIHEDNSASNPIETAASPKDTSPTLMGNDIDTSLTGESSPEFVIYKIVGLRKADDGSWMHKVRWYGYTPADDTWEPSYHLPGNMVSSYHLRVGLPLDHSLYSTY
jgi:hypothetical protein